MKKHEESDQAGHYLDYLRLEQEKVQPAHPSRQPDPIAVASFISGVRRSGRGASTVDISPLHERYHSHIELQAMDAKTTRIVHAAFRATSGMISGDTPPIFDETLRREPARRQLPPAQPPQHEQGDEPPIYRQAREDHEYTQFLGRILEGLHALPDAPAGHDPDARQQVEITPHPERVDEVGYGAAYEEAVRAKVDDAAALALDGPTVELPVLYQSEGTMYRSAAGTHGQGQLPPA